MGEALAVRLRGAQHGGHAVEECGAEKPAEFQTDVVPYPRIRFMPCIYAPIIPSEKTCHVRMSVAEITTIVFQYAPMIVRVLRHGTDMPCVDAQVLH